MTIEDAVERLLLGKPFISCESCKTLGVVNGAECPDCEGNGSISDISYAEACQVLDRPMPTNVKAFWTKALAGISTQKLHKDLVYMAKEDYEDTLQWGKDR